MARNREPLNHWLAPLPAAAVLTGICVMLFVLTRSYGWLSLALGSGTFAGLAWWQIIAGASSEVGRTERPSAAAEGERTLSARQLLDALPDAAAMLRSNGIIADVNDAARDLLQLDAGMDLHAVLRSPELALAVSRAITDHAVATAEVRSGVPVERRLTARIIPLSLDQGASERLLITFRDRTSETQLDQMRTDFVANASHELRTPLASLKGFIETLQGAAKDDPVARGQFLDIMQQEASRMSRLIDDLLSLSRIEMRAHVPPRDRVDLRAVVREVAEMLAPTAERAGQSLTATVPDGEVFARGEKDELVQVVQNLVQNAIKYGKKSGTVSVVLASTRGTATLSVSDDGIGIAKEHIPRLTERFYRVSAKDSRERGGTGLGLAIVKHIVNRHRGHLDIASAPGQGTTVTVSLSNDAKK